MLKAVFQMSVLMVFISVNDVIWGALVVLSLFLTPVLLSHLFKNLTCSWIILELPLYYILTTPARVSDHTAALQFRTNVAE